MRISRKEGHRFTASRSMVSRHVGPVLMKQDVVNFLSETNIRQDVSFDISLVPRPLIKAQERRSIGTR